MAHIQLENASVEFALYSGRHHSLRSKLISTITGGHMARDDSGRLVVRALHDLTLTISDGEKVGLLGHNGAGKSTLLRVLSGVYRPTSGEAAIYGKVGTLIDISLGINPETTGRQNIYLMARLHGLKKKEIDTQVDEIIKFSGLGDFIEMPVRTYSSGMQLRLSFAVSTALYPEILVMDEWLSVGDQGFKSLAEGRLRSMVNEAKILVFASHSRELLESVCTRGIIIEKGRVVEDGPMEAIAQKYFESPGSGTSVA